LWYTLGMSYFGNCRNWNELRACFEHSKYKPPAEPLNVLFSYVWEASYEGSETVDKNLQKSRTIYKKTRFSKSCR